jgi:Peptidase S24-like
LARKKTPKVRLNVKASVSRRLREIREEIFGEHGGPELARRLNLPARTWYNYESGVTVPAEVLLDFIEQTGANPLWLLNGHGQKYHHPNDDPLLSQLTPVELIRRGLEALERSSQSMAIIAPKSVPDINISDYVAVAVYPFSELADTNLVETQVRSHVLARRHWLPNPDETIATQLVDDAMHPILPVGSIVAVDRTATDPRKLDGKIVATCPNGIPMIRWLEVSGRHFILRPNNQVSKEFPLIPIELDEQTNKPIIGQVVWSWSRLSEA